MAAIADALDKVERSGFQVALQQLLRLEQVDGKPSAQGLPVGRCGHSACLWESSLSQGDAEFHDHEVTTTTGLQVIVFGGCGGMKYERTALADLWSLDCDTWAWQQHTFTGTSPAPRQGHSAVVKGNMMFVFGGKIPNQNKPDKPSTKFFVFGGASCEASENPRRFQTQLCSDVGVLTLAEECHWDFITTVSAAAAAAEQRETVERSSQLKRRAQGSIANASQQAMSVNADIPVPREGATMAYFAEDSTLVVFGGWWVTLQKKQSTSNRSGKWLGDLWACCVSSVVGPPYAVLGLSPPCGPMTGGTPIILKGAGFTTGSITVRFSVGDFFADVPGTFVSSTEIHAVTPNVKAALGPRTCEVRVKIGAKDLTSSLCSFQFYANSCASCCLAVGPGLLSDGAPGVPTSFFIEARNAQNGKRTTGGDTFEQQQLPQEPVDEEEAEAKPVEPPVYLPVSITDYGNGTYLATYTAPRPGRVSVSVLLDAQDGTPPQEIRGSPYTATTIFHLQNEREIVQAKVKHDDRRSLLDVRQHIKNVETLRTEHELYIEVLQVALQKLQELGANVDSSNRALKKIGEKRAALEASAEKRCHEMADAFDAEAARTRKAIEELDTSVNALHQTLAGECFYSFSTSPTEARARIKETSERTNELLRTMEALQVPAASFDFPELLSTSRQNLVTMEDELRNVTQFWNVAESMLHQIEEYRGLLWQEVDGVQIEIAVKAMQKSLQKDIKVRPGYLWRTIET
ncbi:LOW QUALITY PROTEIN: uncharacterized protein EMH_0036310 [Eimeria mitis]|uniref:IPT/TIG domain-containing protein n=1 Tax=Eimeria mitis TaxID=44415 RepID=U6JT58_9EIME|nr:LOW QUALITY PROTEIN: uncharacterized protein EMH_0036310 [Eimeria mitis]CDJ27951.1 hypothetical protein, conserved [Eimeria mitis]